MRIIPGHFKAYTFWILLLLSGVTYVETHKWEAVAGMALLVIGLFIADQATHLSQPNHSEPAPTKIERLFQYDKWAFVGVGSFIATFGASILF